MEVVATRPTPGGRDRKINVHWPDLLMSHSGETRCRTRHRSDATYAQSKRLEDKVNLPHVGQIDQIDHDLDHDLDQIDLNLPL